MTIVYFEPRIAEIHKILQKEPLTKDQEERVKLLKQQATKIVQYKLRCYYERNKSD